jgi:hypothetical protein
MPVNSVADEQKSLGGGFRKSVLDVLLGIERHLGLRTGGAAATLKQDMVLQKLNSRARAPFGEGAKSECPAVRSRGGATIRKFRA